MIEIFANASTIFCLIAGFHSANSPFYTEKNSIEIELHDSLKLCLQFWFSFFYSNIFFLFYQYFPFQKYFLLVCFDFYILIFSFQFEPFLRCTTAPLGYRITIIIKLFKVYSTFTYISYYYEEITLF